jgi:hypothetical protein
MVDGRPDYENGYWGANLSSRKARAQAVRGGTPDGEGPDPSLFGAAAACVYAVPGVGVRPARGGLSTHDAASTEQEDRVLHPKGEDGRLVDARSRWLLKTSSLLSSR